MCQQIEKLKKLIDTDLSQLLTMFRKRLGEATADLALKGKLLSVAATERPSLLAYYDQITSELAFCLSMLEIRVKRVRAERMKFIRTHYAKDYTDTAIQKIIDGDKEYIEVYESMLEVKLIYDKSRAITDTFKQRSYDINHLIKIQELQLQDITI